MPAQRLKHFLDANSVAYSLIPHPFTYTAQQAAASAHVTGWELAKTVMVKIDGEMAMAVVPAPEKLSLERLREIAGAQTVTLASEPEFRSHFPECELGAMPPFGNLYGLRVFVDEALSRDRQIAFNAGTHTELIRMSYADFARLVNPTTAAIALPLATAGRY